MFPNKSNMSFQALPSTDPTAFQSSQIALMMNSYSSVRAERSALPPPMQDPNPAATSALHFLWQQLRICVSLGPNGPALANITAEMVETAVHALKSFGDLLVSQITNVSCSIVNLTRSIWLIDCLWRTSYRNSGRFIRKRSRVQSSTLGSIRFFLLYWPRISARDSQIFGGSPRISRKYFQLGMFMTCYVNLLAQYDIFTFVGLFDLSWDRLPRQCSSFGIRNSGICGSPTIYPSGASSFTLRAYR
jgi:hypothetical protein